MTRLGTAAKLLASVYHVADQAVQVIPHGVPEVPRERDETHKDRLGLAGRPVIWLLRVAPTRKTLFSAAVSTVSKSKDFDR